MDRSELNVKMPEIINYIERNLIHIDGAEEFINKLRRRNNENDLIHGLIIKRYHEINKYKITRIEYNNPPIDVDIE